tara:strand:+ start:2493 stop:3212 length:720 start_codon:yes stop_codon:yes gene_type:complete
MQNKETIIDKSKYLDYTYSETLAPKTDYPSMLVSWALQNVFHTTGTVVDFGCGRGDFLTAFQQLGFESYGLDASPNIKELQGFTVKQVNFESDPYPYFTQKFDFAFSKSVVEHLHKPDLYLSAIYDSLEEGGKALVMTPSWEYNYWGPFYIDHTHVTPFTAKSLKSALEMAGFKNVTVKYFYQLPILWKYPFLKIFAKLIAKLPIPYAPYNDVPWDVSNKINKTVRFSKEVMLMASAEK